MKKFNTFIFFLEFIFAFFAATSPCFSQTEVSGNIRTDTTWLSKNSPYKVTGDIHIKDGAALTIEKGVTVNFQNRYLFVGMYQPGQLIADDVIFNNGTIQFNKESGGSIRNTDFNKTRLFMEDYSAPYIEQNNFDDGSTIFIHSPDALPNIQNNSFSGSEITFSFDLDHDLNLDFRSNCTYRLDNDLYIGGDATLSIDKNTILNLSGRTIYVGNYSDARLDAEQANIMHGWVSFSDNSVGRLTNCNFTWIHFDLIEAARLTVSSSNFDSLSTITNNSSLTVEAANNYWGRPEGPVMNESITVLTGDVNYVPFSPVPINTNTGIVENKKVITGYELSQNFPNPFNPATTINYSLGPEAGKSMTKIKIYDMTGREVETLVDKYQGPGNYSVFFNASKLSSGVYVYRLIHGSYNVSKKMIYLK